MKRVKLFFLVLLAMIAASQSVQSQAYRPITHYKVTVTSTVSTAGQAVLAQSRMARVTCSVTCFVAFAVTPIVATLSLPVYLPQNETQYLKVSPGSYAYVIREHPNAHGTLYVTEVE
jgi:hypothetical protein